MFTPSEAWSVIATARGCDHHVEAASSLSEEDIEVVYWFDEGCNCGSLSGQRKAEEAANKRRQALIEGQEGLDDHDEFERNGAGMCRGMCDTWSEAFCRLKDGRYVTAHESSDTSGHGCQCSGSVDIYDTKDDFLRLGLTEASRAEIERLIT